MEFVMGALALGFVLTIFALAKVWEKIVNVEIELKAMQKSTHQLTYIDPLNHDFRKPTKDENSEIEQNFDNPLDSLT